MVRSGTPSALARLAALAIALVAWLGLATQLQASTALAGALGDAIWAMLRYFTVLTNLLVATTFTALALGRRVTPFALGGATLAILLVGIVFALLLNGLVELSGGARLADFLLHRATPLLVPLYWLAFAPKGGIRRYDPLLWALYPLSYFVYALARGAAEGRYAYPFMDVGRLGWPQTGLHALILAAGFLVAGFALRWLDGRMKRD